MKRAELAALLDRAYAECAHEGAVCEALPDPLLIAKKQREVWAVLLCALFAYGNVRAIVGFLGELDFDRRLPPPRGYRFQSIEDVAVIFDALPAVDIEGFFRQGYDQSGVLGGISYAIEAIHQIIGAPLSPGLRFLIGKPFDPRRPKGVGTHKRWLMFARWMARTDAPDLGRWGWLSPSDLVMPLDTHTFRLGRKLGLIKRKSADMLAALEMTASLRRFCPEDPVRYDFALYRLGQSGQL